MSFFPAGVELTAPPKSQLDLRGYFKAGEIDGRKRVKRTGRKGTGENTP